MEARLAAAIEGSSRKGGVYTLSVPLPVVRRVGPHGPALGQVPPPSPSCSVDARSLVGLRAQPSLVFRMALILLVEANERLVLADPSGGRDRQYTILEVPRVLEDDLLRGRLLAAMPDPQIRAMWRTYFTPLDHRFRL